MRFVKQFCVILFFSFVGELLHQWLPLPVPAAVYGILLLFGALQSGLLPLAAVQQTGAFLTDLMPVLFVGPAVGLLESWPLVAPRLLPLLVLVLGSTVFAFGAGGGVGSNWAADLEIPDIWDKAQLEAMTSRVDEIKEKLRPILEIAAAIGAAFLAWRVGSTVITGLKSIASGLGAIKKLASFLFGGPAGAAASKLLGLFTAVVLRFNAAGGGAAGFAAALKLVAVAAAPVVVVVAAIGSALKVLITRWSDIKSAIANVAEELGLLEKLKGLQATLQDLGINLDLVKTLFSGITDIIGGAVVTAFGSLLMGAVSGLLAVFSGLATSLSGVFTILSGLSEFVAGVFTLDLDRVKSGISDVGLGISRVFSGLWQAAVGGIGEFFNGILTTVSELGGVLLHEKLPEVLQGVKDWWRGVVNFFLEALPRWWETNIAPWFTASRWMELGKQALDGLFKGLSEIGTAAADWGKAFIENVKNILGIHSPSTDFEGLGLFAIEGLRAGLSGISFMSQLFGSQLNTMLQSAQSFISQLSALQDLALQAFKQYLSNALNMSEEFTSSMSDMYTLMAIRSVAQIQSIIAYLDSIPRSITTIHTIVTRHVTEGADSDVDEYASGGFPTPGQLFLAREAGPELVGMIGARSAVVNNDQIIQGVAQGVYDAMLRANQAGASDEQPLVIELDGEKLGRSVTKWQQRQGATITKGAYAYAY